MKLQKNVGNDNTWVQDMLCTLQDITTELIQEEHSIYDCKAREVSVNNM